MENSNTVTRKALCKFLKYYFTERNVEKTLSMVTDDIYSLGTGVQEIAFCKKEFEQLLFIDIKGMPAPISYTISNYCEKKRNSDEYDCFCNLETVIEISQTEKLFFFTRLTASFVKVAGEFLANTLHMSEASKQQDDDEFFPLSLASTELKKLDKSSQHELIKILMENMPGGLMGGYVETGFPIYVINDTILKMLGYTYDELMDKTKGMLAETIHPDDLQEHYDSINKSFADGNEYEAEYRMKKRDGSFIWVYDVGRKITTEDGRIAIICVLVDITATVRTRENLIEETMRDPLTNLYNRKAGEKLISKNLQEHGKFTFMIMDIDNFKQVNDVYGHHVGDTILIYLATQLQTAFRSTDIIARLGGDEFMLYIPFDCSVDTVIKKLNSISHDYIHKIQELCPKSQSTISIGGICGKNQNSFQTIYEVADKALYEIKHTRKGNIKIIDIF